MKKALTLIFFFAVLTSCLSQELKTFRGHISYKFQISSAGLLTEEKKMGLKRTMKPYAEKEGLLTEYFKQLNAGDTANARATLGKDKFFKNKDDYTIAYMFSLARMQTLGELFRPCIQVYDDQARGVIISCTKEQFDDLTEEDTRVFEIVCRYVGDLYVDDVKLYEMVRYR